eukprot:TRINITY_DN68_c0_g1_i1.p1 TRINITY_DN68_c0_g1~~TRINITY_DN68_c0_g1_i1.p1  ORF type:complete len:316 (+),score=50.95 TRINITY_DN68_c0_g1_i1:100-1047(+)
MITLRSTLSVVLLVLVFVVLGCQASSSNDRRYVRGGWRDQYNRTIWICSSCDDWTNSKQCRYYISWTRVNSTVNITGFANAVLEKDRDDGDRLRFHGKYWEMNNITQRSQGKDAITQAPFTMKLYNPSADYEVTTYWKGVKGDEDEEWIWNRRFFNEEPAPSSCMNPVTLQPPILVGRWQRVASNGDVLYVNICPNGDGRWQWAFSGLGGLLRGKIEKHSNLTQWTGRRIYTNRTSLHHMNETDIEAITGASIFTQVGFRVLNEINTNQFGAWVESRTFNYIGVPEDCSSSPSLKFTAILQIVSALLLYCYYNFL